MAAGVIATVKHEWTYASFHFIFVGHRRPRRDGGWGNEIEFKYFARRVRV